MSYKYSCSHLSTVTDVPIASFINSKERPTCSDCDAPGPNLWICLHRGCLKIGCSSNLKDHSTLHNNEEPSHCIHMNMSDHRVWCYKCQSEVYVDRPSPPPQRSVADYDSDQEPEDCHVASRDSGHGSYSTLQAGTPEHGDTFTFRKTVTNRMSGDTSESSDNEELDVISNEKPVGLVGLQNIGNTCYMNAALQALSNTIPLTNFFLECPATVHLLSEDRKPGLSRQYQALIRDIWLKKNGGYVTPTGILYGIRNVHAMFRGYHQHDTQEFLRNFMDQLHEELKQATPPECSINDVENLCIAVDEPTLNSNYESSEGEYETCDSGVSERSSLSDDTEQTGSSTKRRMSRGSSPSRRLRARIHSNSVIDSQPGSSGMATNSSQHPQSTRKQIKYRSIISDIFDGKLLSSVQCLTCDRVSSRVETFQDLSLPIPSRDHLMVLHGRNSAPGATCSEVVLPVQDGWISWILAWLRSWFYGPTVTLHDCLAAFFSTDELKGDNMYSCEKCNKLRNGLKYSKVLQLPEVLCIHLKRFRHELMFSSKISAVVSFPLKGLDMRPYLHKDCVSQITTYELFSVICHHGTAGGGHYTCYALNNSQWYEFDDQCVTRVHAETVQNCEAYVLFYRKVTAGVYGVKQRASEIAEEVSGDDLKDVAYVSKQWLSRFNTCAEPGPIDNSDFLCGHNAVSPKRAIALEQLATVLPRKVYDYLYKKYGGCPAVTSATTCAYCQAIQTRINSELETLQRLNNDFERQEEPPSHLLSSTWYAQWKAFVEKRLPEPPGPVENTQPDENFIKINLPIWKFFAGIYGGGPEVLIPRLIEDGLCKGEPMETEAETSPEDGDELDQKLCNNANHSSNSQSSVTTTQDEGEKEGESVVINIDVKHRRRRRRDVN